MQPTTLDLRGARLPIISPSGQPIAVLFDFAPTDVSTWTWLGHVRSDPVSASPVAAFVFTNPVPTQLLATLNDAAVATLAPATSWFYEIDQVTPTHRQMFFGTLKIEQDTAR